VGKKMRTNIIKIFLITKTSSKKCFKLKREYSSPPLLPRKYSVRIAMAIGTISVNNANPIFCNRPGSKLLA